MNINIEILKLKIWWEQHHYMAGASVGQPEVMQRAANNIMKFQKEIEDIELLEKASKL